MPDNTVITQEEAIEIMYAYYEEEYGLVQADFDEQKMSIAFKEQTWDDGSGPERLTTWEMNLWLKGDLYPMGISILPDGTIKQAVGPYMRTWRDDWYDTMMADDFWTVEGLYRFQQEWEPKVEQLIAGGEDISTTSDLYYLLSKQFGLPNDQDITRDEAYTAAITAILALPNWDQEKLSYFTTREAYRTDNPDSPVYWFAFVWSYDENLRSQAIKRFSEESDIPRMMIVKVNARTGEIVELYENNSTDRTERLGM